MKVTIKDCRDEGRNLPWLVTYYVNRKPVRKYFTTEAEAKTYASECRDALRRGTDPVAYQQAQRKAAGIAYSLLELVELGSAHLAARASKSGRGCFNGGPSGDAQPRIAKQGGDPLNRSRFNFSSE